MSIRATDYALRCLEDDDELTTAARLVLMLLAARASSQTGITYTGGWLQDATGLGRSALWRVMAQLRESAYVTFDEREGSAHRVRFPVVSPLSTPVASARQVPATHPSRWRDGGVAPGARVSGSLSVPTEFSREGEGVACACDDTGWIFDPTTRTVSPCPSHPARCRGEGS